MRDKTQINPIRGGFFKFCRIYIRENFSRRSKRSPGSTRAAPGACVTKIVGGGREKDPHRRREEVLEKRKF